MASGNRLTAGLRPMHPGELLREEVLPGLGRSAGEVAALLGVSPRRFGQVLAERRPVTADLALRIGKLLGVTAESWVQMQVNYDLRTTEQRLGADLAAIPVLRQTRRRA